ncbi:MAG: hypothetical protein WD399_07285 [Thermoleophilaceae bacterium]
MDPLVMRFVAAPGADSLTRGVDELRRTVEAHGGHALTSWTLGETGYAVVDVTSFQAEIDAVFDHVPVVFEAGAPVIIPPAPLERAGILGEIFSAATGPYHIDLPAAEAPTAMALRKPRVVCTQCSRIGHEGPPCPDV